MINIIKRATAVAATTVTLAATSASYAADSVNVAFFLRVGNTKSDLKSR
jgi:hypothetical protein